MGISSATKCCAVSQKLGESLRDTDLLARFGGEEFAALLTVTPARTGQIAAERARRLVENSTFYFDGQPLRVTVSCGLAEPVDGEETIDLIRRADSALYASKHAGRNCSHGHDGARMRSHFAGGQRIAGRSRAL